MQKEELCNKFLIALTEEQLREINGGSERKDEKLSNWLEKLWMKFTGAIS